MNGLTSWLADKLSLALESHEREALHGDHAELRLSGPRALKDVLGLVIRRQLQVWSHWRPWIALLGIAVPFGLFLSAQTLVLGVKLGPILLAIPAGPDPSSGDNDFYPFVLFLGGGCFLVGLSSWSAGFAVSSLSHRAARIINSGLFLASWLVALGVTLSVPALYEDLAGRPNGLEFAIAFHAIVFVIPAAAGLICGSQKRPLSQRVIIFVAWLHVAAAIAMAVGLASVDHWRGLTKETAAIVLVIFGVLSWPGLLGLTQAYRARRTRNSA